MRAGRDRPRARNVHAFGRLGVGDDRCSVNGKVDWRMNASTVANATRHGQTIRLKAEGVLCLWVTELHAAELARRKAS